MRPLKLLLVLLIIIAFSSPAVALTRDIMLEPRTTALNDTVDDLFIITNLDHESGRTDSIRVTIRYNATWVDGYANGTASKTINKYTASGTGALTIDGAVSTVLLCGAVETDVNDTNPDNDEGCWELSRNLTGTQQEENPTFIEESEEQNATLNETDDTTDEDTNTTTEEEPSTESNTTTSGEPDEEEHPDCDPISITGLPLITADGEKLRYAFEPWLEGDQVTYWIEDAFGDNLKREVSTTTDSRKSYTPHTDEKDTAIIIKARRERDGCEDAETTAVVVVRGEEDACQAPDEEDEGPCVCEFTCPTCDVPAPFTSLYVRASNHKETITMYGRSEEESLAWLVGANEARKVAVPEGSFKLRIHPSAGNNTYLLVPVMGGEPQVARFTLESEEAEEGPAAERTCEETLAGTRGSYRLPPNTTAPATTGSVVLEEDADGTGLIPVLAGAAGFLVLAATGMQRFKKKPSLRGGHGVTREQAEPEGNQGESR